MAGQVIRSDWCVVGGGIGGCYAAYVLAKSGLSVVLLEGGKRVEGILSSTEWQGFQLDNGCHVFDYSDLASAKFFNLVMEDAVRPISINYASISQYEKTKGIAVPDLSAAPLSHRNALLNSVRTAIAETPKSVSTLPDAVNARFGELFAAELMPGINKLCGFAADTLSADAFEILSYAKRVRVGNDEQMASLKALDPKLDERLAIKAKPSTLIRNCYPKQGSMNTFCDRLRVFLESIGVTVVLENRVGSIRHDQGRVSITGERHVDAGKVFWSMPSSTLAFALDDLPDPKPHYHPVSVELWALKVDADQISPETHIYDYRGENPIFRSASVGVYSNQIDASGDSFVVAEIYDSLVNPGRSTGSVTAETVLSDLKSMGQLSDRARVADSTSWRIPTALMLPKVGWRSALQPISDRLEAEKDWLVANTLVPRGKRSIFATVDEMLADHLA